MIAVACVFLFLAIKKGFEPLLLVPIAFGMLLVNIYPDIMANPEDMSNGVGGLLHYFYLIDEWSIPSIPDLHGCRCDDRLRSADRQSEELPSWCSCTAWYLCSIFPCNASLDSTEKQQQLSPSSVELMALPPFSLLVNLDRPLLWNRSQWQHIPICHWFRSSSRLS